VRFNEEWFDFVYTTAHDYRVDFTADASMANVATSIETALRTALPPMLFAGQTETTVATWAAIDDGSFQIWVDGVRKQYTGIDFANYGGAGVPVASMAEVADAIDTAITADGFACEYDSTATRLFFSHDTAGATHWLSYVEAHASGTGTDIASLIGARETDSGTVLNRRGKDAEVTTTFKYSAPTFILSTSNSGDAYRFSFLEAPSISTASDISGASWINGLKTASYAAYTPGRTAGQTLMGTGVIFGEWAQGMQLEISGSEGKYLIDAYRDTDHLLLDGTYSGPALDTYTAYSLLPFDNQLYPSHLGNPFDYPAENIISLPTQDNDSIVGQRVSGRNLLVWMKRHLWAVDAANPQAPRLISSEAGAVTNESIVTDGTAWFFFDGEEFWKATFNQVSKLDPDGRVRDFVSRLSTATRTKVHAQYIPLAGKSVVFWTFGLDASTFLDTAVVYHPASGNWWTWNVHDMTCTCIVRDGQNRPYMLSGSSQVESGDSYTDSVAWVFKHGSDYYADGMRAITDGNTKEGIIKAVTSAVTAAAYLTTGTIGQTWATWAAVTDAYFRVVIDGTEYTIGPVNLSTVSSGTTLAGLLETAIQTATGSAETVTYSGGKLTITSATTTVSSSIGYILPSTSGTDISGRAYLNGLECDGYASKVPPQNIQAFTLYASDGATDATCNTVDGETGIWVYVCDANMENGQFGLLLSQTNANTFVCYPAFSTSPEAGWYWFLGGIVPEWFKWFDFGSPQHEHQLREISLTIGRQTSTHYAGLQVYHALNSTTSRASYRVTLGGSTDTETTTRITDKASPHIGVRFKRPSSLVGLTLSDITLTQHSET
jgi:hypothetical protein